MNYEDYKKETAMDHMLDLDLDFFLDHRETDADDNGPRLDEDHYCPWSEAQVRQFLEDACGLSRNKPIMGRLVKHHDEAFYWWKELVETHQITAPFEVTHIDAHSDTGFDMHGSRSYIMTQLLSLPLDQRANPRRGLSGLNPGNYLIFAVACRWLAKVRYVLHPEAGNDFENFHFKNFDVLSGAIQLKNCSPDDFVISWTSIDLKNFVAEPEVPYELIAEDYVADRPFTHAVLSQSPGFTPKSSDKLIPIILEYFKTS